MYFDDIIGAESARTELRYFVQYLRDPTAFSGAGVGTPKGVLEDIAENRAAMDRLVDELIKKDRLTSPDIGSILSGK